MERHTLCKKIVRGVILAAKHESRADTEVVSMHRASNRARNAHSGTEAAEQ